MTVVVVVVVVVLGMFVLLAAWSHTAGHPTPPTGRRRAGRVPVATARGPPPASAGPEAVWPTSLPTQLSRNDNGESQQHMTISVGRAAPGHQMLDLNH